MFKSLFKKKDKPKEYRVVIPEETFTMMEWKSEGLPCIGMLNSALDGFEPKEVFSWHLSLIIDFKELIDNGMPSQEERDVVDPFCDELDENIKAKGNALFIVRETWNGTRRLVWRVYDPEIANEYLQSLIQNNDHPREFDFHMEQDLEWEQAKWYFDQLKT